MKRNNKLGLPLKLRDFSHPLFFHAVDLYIVSVDAPCNCDGVVGGVSGSSLSAPVAAAAAADAPDALGLPRDAPFAAFFDFEAELLEAAAVDDEDPDATAFDCFCACCSCCCCCCCCRRRRG